jgi:hypothetical protein
MKAIKRKVKFYVTTAQKFRTEEGQPIAEDLPVLETTKKFSRVSLEKHFKKFLKDGETVLVGETVHKEKTFEMDLDYFITNSTEIQEGQAS